MTGPGDDDPVDPADVDADEAWIAALAAGHSDDPLTSRVSAWRAEVSPWRHRAAGLMRAVGLRRLAVRLLMPPRP